jgi:hypothetical protein
MTGLDSPTHYLRYGHRMSHDPGAEFSTRFARTVHGIRDEHERSRGWTGCAARPKAPRLRLRVDARAYDQTECV